MKPNKLIVFSAPSGAGKTTIVRHLLQTFPDLAFSISATTRLQRAHETHSKDYYFISKEEFEHKIAQDEFVEYEEVYAGVLYGTLKSEIRRLWAMNKQVLFDMDVKGGLNLKQKYPEQTLAIFIQPPSVEILQQRLQNRQTEDSKTLQTRIAKATYELSFAPQFDRILVNDVLEDALAEAEQIVKGFL